MAHALTVSLIETPLTGEPYAGNPPVRFGGRGGANPAIPTPIDANNLGMVRQEKVPDAEGESPSRQDMET